MSTAPNNPADMHSWTIERGQAYGGLKVARIQTPHGWLCVAPADTLTDVDLRMMAGIFIAGRDERYAAHRTEGSGPVETGL